MDKEAAREKAWREIKSTWTENGTEVTAASPAFYEGFDAGWKAHDREWVRIETDGLPKESGIYAVAIPGLEGKLEVQYDAFHANSQSWAHYRGHKAWLPLPPFRENDQD